MAKQPPVLVAIQFELPVVSNVALTVVGITMCLMQRREVPNPL